MKSKLLTALLAVVIALGLWLYVVTVVSPNSDRLYPNVEVTLQGESILQERGLMIVTKKLPVVSLHLEGNRTDLDKLNSANITLTVDVSKIGEAGVHNLRFTPSYPGDVATGNISVLSQNPASVSIEVEERVSKPVPVAIKYTGNLEDGFMADKENVVLDSESVNVVGPKSVVDNIAMAQVELSLDGRSETVNEELTYTLCDAEERPVNADMVATNVEKIALMLRIARVKEVGLILNVVDGGGATRETTKIDQDPLTIQISGSDSLMQEIESIELGTVNLAEIPADETLMFPISLPEGITNETGVTEAKVEIRFPALETKTVTVDTIQPVNIPAGLEAELITKVLEIKLRGPKEKVQLMEAGNVTVTVDFANVQTGTATVKAEIKISDESVGALGSYQVAATLREKTKNGETNGSAG